METVSGTALSQFNRRQFPRINITLPVEYTMTLDINPCLSTRTGTLGGGGLMLYLPMAVGIGTQMKLKICLPDQVTIPCTVRVVWTELLTGQESGEFKTGVAFEQILDPDLERLRSFIAGQQNPTELPAALYNRSLE